MPQEQTPYIYFVLVRELRLYTLSEIMDYIAGQYSVSAIDTPERGYELAFSENQDFLSATVMFTANDVMNVIINLDDELTAPIFDDTLDDDFKIKQDQYTMSCLERMLDALDEPLSANFLCRQIRTEMLFHFTKLQGNKEIMKKRFHNIIKESSRKWGVSVFGIVIVITLVCGVLSSGLLHFNGNNNKSKGNMDIQYSQENRTSSKLQSQQNHQKKVTAI